MILTNNQLPIKWIPLSYGFSPSYFSYLACNLVFSLGTCFWLLLWRGILICGWVSGNNNRRRKSKCVKFTPQRYMQILNLQNFLRKFYAIMLFFINFALGACRGKYVIASPRNSPSAGSPPWSVLGRVYWSKVSKCLLSAGSPLCSALGRVCWALYQRSARMGLCKKSS